MNKESSRSHSLLTLKVESTQVTQNGMTKQVCLSCLSVCLFVSLSVCLYVCLFVCLSRKGTHDGTAKQMCMLKEPFKSAL